MPGNLEGRQYKAGAGALFAHGSARIKTSGTGDSPGTGRTEATVELSDRGIAGGQVCVPPFAGESRCDIRDAGRRLQFSVSESPCPKKLSFSGLLLSTELGYRKREENLRRAAHADAFLNIKNRNAMEAHRRALMKRNAPRSVGVVYLDLNGLKQTNDRYDHKAGDRLLQREVDFVAAYFHVNIFSDRASQDNCGHRYLEEKQAGQAA